MAQEASRVKLTYEDLVQMPEDGHRHELIDGEHYVTASPSTRHQRALTRLLVALDAYLKESGQGEVFPAPFDVVLSAFDVVEPDLVVVTHATPGFVTEANVQGAPALVVEILSPNTRSRDRGLKRRLYEKFGVQEYWIVEPAARTVEILELADGRWVPNEPLTRDDTLVSRALPGLELPLSSVFEN